MDVQAMGEWAEIVPVSGLKGIQVELLEDLLFKQLPVSPKLYPDDIETGESEDDLICELVREAALELVEDELPHSLAVTLDEIVLSDDKPNIHVSLWVERDSQKGIVIGRAGSMLKKIGSEARTQIQTLLGYPVHLSIQVRVAPDWQRNPKQLGKLGF
jgi:GTP-binding protein Era